MTLRRAVRGVRRRLLLARRPIRLSRRRAAELERVLDGLRDFDDVVCAAAPGGRLLERDGVVAAVVPVAPDHPTINAVVYERAGALAAALDDLATTYEDAGIRAWMVLAPAVDGAAKRLLRRAGHVRVGSASGMTRRLDGVERPAAPALYAWTSAGDPATLATICDRAFSSGDAFARALAGLPRDSAHVYLASLDGAPASCVMTVDRDRNCAIELMATVPEARGHGLSTLLLGHALADAAERGCETSTVVASRLGERIYRRLGYRPVCPIQQWVWRRT
jgi:GNAT superfamily N-acetyltransferase